MWPVIAAHPLVNLNAALNATATILLIVGLWLIKTGRERAHKRVMLAAFGVSVAFLVSYLTYHRLVGHVPFSHDGIPRIVYLTVLATHIPLAMCVPPLAILTIYFGWKTSPSSPTDEDNEDHLRDESIRHARRRHRQLARWTFPIWLYVSVTGVIVYVMLYHLYPAEAAWRNDDLHGDHVHARGPALRVTADDLATSASSF